MGVKSARAPWSTLTGRGRGRPRKGEPGSVGCIWPEADGTCPAPRRPGLALCAGHAEVLSGSSRHCCWPGCVQSSPRALCTYHDKVVHLLIDAPGP
jgi:hypothetical protein